MGPTAGAAAGYASDKSRKDANMVAELCTAEPIFLGKSNLDEYAPAGTGRSFLGGQTCQPCDIMRIPGGSRAGDGAAGAGAKAETPDGPNIEVLEAAIKLCDRGLLQDEPSFPSLWNSWLVRSTKRCRLRLRPPPRLAPSSGGRRADSHRASDRLQM